MHYTGEILRTLSGHDQGVSDIAWSHDGEFLASASDDKTIKNMEHGSGAPLHFADIRCPVLLS